MRKPIAVLPGIVLMTFCAATEAQQLPKSGSINVHTGWKDTGVVLAVADKRVQGQGMVTGITFNDKGAGPLHGGPANCSYTFAGIDGNSRNKGYCTFSDADGDRIFTDFSGSGTPDGQGNGTNEITGGTGKYAGIQGSGPWKCKYVGSNGESHCSQRFDYRLP